MKKTIVIGGLLSMIVTLQVSAQGLENDDMYFNSKDREKLKTAEAEGTVNAITIPKKQKDSEFVSLPVENTNPTDSYSARIINPEYIARANSAQASAEESYFVENYGASANTYDSYSATNYNNTNTGSNYSNSYNNCGGNSMFGSGLGYSPYSSYYNPYMMNPYSYGSGTTVSLGYNSGCGCGSGWNYGLSYMMGNSFYNPHSYYPSSYYPYYGYGGYPASYGGSTEYSTRNYAKRPSRHSAIVIPIQRTTQQVSTTNTNSGSRVRQSPDEYYVKPARRTSSWSTASPSGSYNRSNSDYSRTRSGGNSYSSPSRNSYSSPSRSSYSSPSRSGGGGGGGGGHSRGH